MDKNGYNPSIVQEDTSCCYLCGKTDGKLDRHEIFFGMANRKKSKADGLWVMLCHDGCHQGPNGVHHNRELREYLCHEGQRKAMEVIGYTEYGFIHRYGKNWL